MACIFTIETSTTVCSVAFAADGNILYDRASFEGPSHASLAGLFMEEAIGEMKRLGLKPDAVAVSSGPGSYTGLRIGTSLAKGLCFGFGVPLLAIPTLELLAATAIRRQPDAEARYCPLMDARRMEVYTALYDARLQPLRTATAEVVGTESFADDLRQGRVYFFGNGAEKCKSVLTAANARFIDAVYPLASTMVPLADRAFAEGRFQDVAYFEPFYLKEFQATVAKNKVLGKA